MSVPVCLPGSEHRGAAARGAAGVGSLSLCETATKARTAPQPTCPSTGSPASKPAPSPASPRLGRQTAAASGCPQAVVRHGQFVVFGRVAAQDDDSTHRLLLMKRSASFLRQAIAMAWGPACPLRYPRTAELRSNPELPNRSRHRLPPPSLSG
jgi:hypothetical protein